MAAEAPHLTLPAIAGGVATFLPDATPLAATCRVLRCVVHFDSYLQHGQSQFYGSCDRCCEEIAVQVVRHTHEWCGHERFVRYWGAQDQSYAWHAVGRRDGDELWCAACIPRAHRLYRQEERLQKAILPWIPQP